MYQVQLEVDSDDVVDESRLYENDNETRHHFFVPSDQKFNITKIASRQSPPGPAVATFAVTKPFGSAANRVFYQALTQRGGTVFTVPAPPVALNLNFGKPLIVMSAFPGPPGPFEGVTGKITVISEDGCIIKQESHTVF